MADNDRQDIENHQPAQPPQPPGGGELDDAGRSLAEALRYSFIILKVVMIIMVLIFLGSGFRTVGSDEQALVLRFGKIRGLGEKRILGPGLHWVFPYPIDEIVKIPVEKKINLPINSFWYYQTLTDAVPEGPKYKPPVPETLDPIKDGYCITRSEKKEDLTAADSSDYNIVHSKWQLTYKIDDPERFFKNIYVERPKPGQRYAQVITKSVMPLLENIVADAVVTAMVNYTIDEAIRSQQRIPGHVQALVQQKLDKMGSGIKAVSVQLTAASPPRQVELSFLASIMASQAAQKAISQAQGYAEKTLNEATGLAHLFKNKTIAELTEQQEQLFWAQLAGSAAETLAHARAYRTEVVETARANAQYLQTLLPEYRKRPRLVVQKLYQDALEYIFENIEEKMIIQPSEGAKGKEIRVMLNRDPSIKPSLSED